jgi:hypothetical protein
MAQCRAYAQIVTGLYGRGDREGKVEGKVTDAFSMKALSQGACCFPFPSEGPDSAGIRAELFIASCGFAFEEPAATVRRGAAGAADEAGHFAGESLPERGPQIYRPVAKPERSAVAV